MKYSAMFLMFCLSSLIVLNSCSKESNATTNPEERSAPKLSIIKQDGQDLTRYYYENDKLIEIQYEVYQYVEETDSVYYDTYYKYFEYENDKLSRVYSGSDETFINYQGADLVITSFHPQYEDATLTFRDYEDKDNFRVELFYQDGFEPAFSPAFDVDNNLLYANDDDGTRIRESYPGYTYLSQYYGDYTYNDKWHQFSGFDLEVQLYLYQKPLVNGVEIYDRGGNYLTYTYEYNVDGYPTSSEATRIYPTLNESIFLGKKDYFYE